MNRLIPDAAATLSAEETKTLKAVLIPCVICVLFITFVSAENLRWHTTGYYPEALARVRYVNDASLLTPATVREICHNPLTQPELRIKSGSLYLRCGTPGLEGVWKIEKFH
ncbi:hypothetical protein [Escherichia coli]|uniref:hypothetical protein n=1 Tax=Escherichia coli TaxID=562 RepID=UPI000BE549CD|nr:hypothetical protein [Escherichia coli]